MALCRVGQGGTTEKTKQKKTEEMKENENIHDVFRIMGNLGRI